MPNVIPFPRQSKNHGDLTKKLEVLLKQAAEGKIVSLAYLVERKDSSHVFGLSGDYFDHPEKVYVPANRAIYGLCTHIHDSGLTI